MSSGSFDWSETTPSAVRDPETAFYRESGSGHAVSRTAVLWRTGPTMLTLTEAQMRLRLRWPLFLKLPGGFNEYVFDRTQVLGLSLRQGLFRNSGTLRVIHSVEDYAHDLTYRSEHLCELREALGRFGWPVESE